MTERSDEASTILPVVEEQAVVLKRRAVADGVRVVTRVQTRQETIAEPLTVEEIEVERTPVDRIVDQPVPVREEGDTTIVTLHEEVTVVERRLRAVEEIRLTRRRSTRHVAETVTLRREEAAVERLPVAGAAPTRESRDPDSAPPRQPEPEA